MANLPNYIEGTKPFEPFQICIFAILYKICYSEILNKIHNELTDGATYSRLCQLRITIEGMQDSVFSPYFFLSDESINLLINSAYLSLFKTLQSFRSLRFENGISICINILSVRHSYIVKERYNKKGKSFLF